MTYAPANVMSPFGYWQLIGATVLGYLISREVPDLFTWVGAAVIISAGIYLAPSYVGCGTGASDPISRWRQMPIRIAGSTAVATSVA
jgi:hypothetical protein